MGQRHEDIETGFGFTSTFHGDDSNKRHRVTNKMQILQYNPGESGREVSLMLAAGISKEMKRGQAIRLEIGYKWTLPAFRLTNNHILHDLSYSHFSKDDQGNVYESYNYQSGIEKFPISMIGFYGNITYHFKLFGQSDK